jgi:hypothetical protein
LPLKQAAPPFFVDLDRGQLPHNNDCVWVVVVTAMMMTIRLRIRRGGKEGDESQEQ